MFRIGALEIVSGHTSVRLKLSLIRSSPIEVTSDLTRSRPLSNRYHPDDIIILKISYGLFVLLHCSRSPALLREGGVEHTHNKLKNLKKVIR